MPIAASRGEPPPTSSLELVACGCNGFRAARLMPDSECLAFGGVVNFTCGEGDREKRNWKCVRVWEWDKCQGVVTLI